MTVKLKGKWALVTGASRGIGQQVARGLAYQGCNLVLHSRHTQHTQAMVSELAGAALDKFVRDTSASLRGTGVLMNMLDPGWLRTDLGGPDAPNSVTSVMPGALVPALIDGEVHGVLFRAQDYAGGSPNN